MSQVSFHIQTDFQALSSLALFLLPFLVDSLTELQELLVSHDSLSLVRPFRFQPQDHQPRTVAPASCCPLSLPVPAIPACVLQILLCIPVDLSSSSITKDARSCLFFFCTSSTFVSALRQHLLFSPSAPNPTKNVSTAICRQTTSELTSPLPPQQGPQLSTNRQDYDVNCASRSLSAPKPTLLQSLKTTTLHRREATIEKLSGHSSRPPSSSFSLPGLATSDA